VWDFAEGFSSAEGSEHIHESDAVVVWFGADMQPSVEFVLKGTLHEGDIPTTAVRAFVFEIL
jgi:hypothetical protein